MTQTAFSGRRRERALAFALVAAGLAFSLPAEYAVVCVTNVAGRLELDSSSTVPKLVAGTRHQTAFPAEVGTPIFWFDCRQTSTWTIDGDNKVTKIPSLVGERYLTLDAEGGDHGYTWTASAPVLEANEPRLGGPALDFGVKGSRRALLFNPGTDNVNGLENIRTVYAVWYSASGDGEWREGGYWGGQLLGGGWGVDGAGTATDKAGYVLGRGGNAGRDAALGDDGRPRWYDNVMINPSHTHVYLRNAHIRQNGQATCADTSGFSGDWEVIGNVLDVDSIGVAGMKANGLGMNDHRIADISGGFKVAEWILFDKLLTHEEGAKVEAYLNHKWFSDARGDNGNAFVGRVRSHRNLSGTPGNSDLEIDVPAGETLTIGQLTGGRGVNGRARKTGTGTLVLGDARAFGGTLVLDGGTLAFKNRSVPDALPRDPFFHLDPTAADHFAYDEQNRFLHAKNCAPRNGWKDNELYLRPDPTFDVRVLTNALGAGRHVLDFGNSVDAANRIAYFATNATMNVADCKATPSGMLTVLAVVGAQRGGGGLVRPVSGAGYFSRATSAIINRYNLGFFNSHSDGDSLLANVYGRAWIDSLPQDPSAGYASPGYQVVALRVPGSAAMAGIGATAWKSGGLRVGEMAIYTRTLTDDEIRDASAHLMRKWFGKTAPGYAEDAPLKTPTLLRLVAEGDGTIDVPEGATVRIGEIAAAGGSLVKTGAGTLEFVKSSVPIVVADGHIVRGVPPDVATACEVAAEPSLHLDADDLSSFDFDDADGEQRVLGWYSKNDRTTMATVPHTSNSDYSRYALAPYLSPDVVLNGRRTLDFGPYGASNGGRALMFSRMFENVRSAYVVFCLRDDARGTFFSCNTMAGTDNECYDFLRPTDSSALLHSNSTVDGVKAGEILTNGVPCAYNAALQPGQWVLAEFHPQTPAHVSMMGTDRGGTGSFGGIRVAEVVLFERALSEREKIATRNYLLNRYFPAVAPTDLPENAPENLGHLRIAGEIEMEFPYGADAKSVMGEGTFVKSGDSTLAVTDLSYFTGTVSVAEGTLKLAGCAQTPGAVVEDAVLFHADPAFGMTLQTGPNGERQIVEWKSKKDDGWSLRPLFENWYPTFETADDLGTFGNQAVFMRSTSGNVQALRFYKDGETNALYTIGSVFWVVGSQMGGGHLLGGGYNGSGTFNWMRGNANGGAGIVSSAEILNSAWVCPENIKTAEWRLNGETVDPLVVGLSGGWDLVSCNIVKANAPHTSADGLAFDGRVFRPDQTGYYQNAQYAGHQEIAELIIYDRKVTEEERVSTENYLRNRWCLGGVAAEATNSADVRLAAGTTLDLDGKRQHLASVSGAGTVSNGTLALGTLVVDGAATVPAYSGVTLEIAQGQEVLVRNVAIDQETFYPIAICAIDPSATRAVLRSASFAFENCTGYNGCARLVYENGRLGVRFGIPGTVLIFR